MCNIEKLNQNHPNFLIRSLKYHDNNINKAVFCSLNGHEYKNNINKCNINRRYFYKPFLRLILTKQTSNTIIINKNRKPATPAPANIPIFVPPRYKKFNDK